MPAHNAESFIGTAIKSVQAQTYKNWQLCIVDDGSTDMTATVAQGHANKDGRIVVERSEHSGCPTARNTTLKMADGDIIAKLDADDTHDPLRIQQQVNFLLKNEDVDIVSCNMNWLKNGLVMRKKTGPMFPQQYLAGKSNGPCCASLVTWRRVYDVVGGYDPDQLAGSDGDWNFRAIMANMRWGHLPGYWYNQRRHKNQISQAMRMMQRQVHQESREKYAKAYREKR
jgi:glycosyltransferase involved in cell wall biosynthesis